MQAVSAVLQGKYTMSGEQFETVEVDFGRSAANNITQAGDANGQNRMLTPLIRRMIWMRTAILLPVPSILRLWTVLSGVC